MNHQKDTQITMIAAERRNRIYKWAQEFGSVNVTWLVQRLGVGSNTVRNDLDVLQREGKLVRSHGGAVIREKEPARQTYAQTRNANIAEKVAIGEAALAYLPSTGSVFLGAGSTCYQLAVRVPESRQIHVVTTSPEVALCLASGTMATVDLLGGRVRTDAYGTDASLSEETLDILFWDVTFLGVTAVDPRRGISSIDRNAALFERKVVEHGSKIVVLCDSSKLGQFSYVKVAPVNTIDVLITDSGASPEMVQNLIDEGVEVVIAQVHQDQANTTNESETMA